MEADGGERERREKDREEGEGEGNEGYVHVATPTPISGQYITASVCSIYVYMHREF